METKPDETAAVEMRGHASTPVGLASRPDEAAAGHVVCTTASNGSEEKLRVQLKRAAELLAKCALQMRLCTAFA